MTNKMKQMSSISTWCWSPRSNLMGASGTELGELKIYQWNDFTFQLKTSARLTTLAWKEDMIAGGTEKGDLEWYHVPSIIEDKKDDSVLFKTHTAVKALDFSTDYLASVGDEPVVSIWDLNQSTLLTGLKSTKLPSTIHHVAWNPQVQHIVAACGHGYTVVWDLRTQREILSLHTESKMIASLAWHPHIGTQLMTASKDSQDPVLSLWDLRYVHAPEKILRGHTDGILDMAWCAQDPDRLLSCDRAGRVHCWNGQDESAVVVQVSSGMISQVDFCPSQPDLFSVRSSRHQLTVYAVPPSVRPSRMIKRRAGVAFGFGGRCITWHDRYVKVHGVPIDPSLQARIEGLERPEGKGHGDMFRILRSDQPRQELIKYIQQQYPVTVPRTEKQERVIVDDPAVDHAMTQAMAMGDFEEAVRVCLEHERYADALMMSACGGSELFERTQQVYLERQRYGRMLRGILSGDLERVLDTADVKEWPTLLVMLCTFASADEFGSLCDRMAERLEDEDALLFYLASGNIKHVSRIWKASVDMKDEMALQGLMEQWVVYKKIVQSSEIEDEEEEEIVGTYAEMLVQYGYLEMALKYLQGMKHHPLYERIYQSLKKTDTIQVKPIYLVPPRRQKAPPSSNTTLNYYSAHG